MVVLLKIDPRPDVQKLYDMHLPVSFAEGSFNVTVRNGLLKRVFIIISQT